MKKSLAGQHILPCLQSGQASLPQTTGFPRSQSNSVDNVKTRMDQLNRMYKRNAPLRALKTKV
ncbi:MAG: hypothetical protein GF416_02105 [Candidatus Altiarchaeales archaeon]|nr:hypothetical protein [Candidatus Altiarchaeales archaeon]